MGKEVMDIAFFVIQLFNGLLQLFLTIFTGLQGNNDCNGRNVLMLVSLTYSIIMFSGFRNITLIGILFIICA